MSEYLWHWKKGNKKVYTCQTEHAEQALKDGCLVMGARIKHLSLNPEDIFI